MAIGTYRNREVKRARFDRLARQSLLFELDEKKKKHFNMREMREIFGRGRSTIAKWITYGFLKPGRINGRLSFHIDDVKRFIIQNSEDEIYD